MQMLFQMEFHQDFSVDAFDSFMNYFWKEEGISTMRNTFAYFAEHKQEMTNKSICVTRWENGTHVTCRFSYIETLYR